MTANELRNLPPRDLLIRLGVQVEAALSALDAAGLVDENPLPRGKQDYQPLCSIGDFDIWPRTNWREL